MNNCKHSTNGAIGEKIHWPVTKSFRNLTYQEGRILSEIEGKFKFSRDTQVGCFLHYRPGIGAYLYSRSSIFSQDFSRAVNNTLMQSL